MPREEDKSYIEELKKSLYSRTAPDVRTRRKLRFTDDAPQINTDWGKNADEAKEPIILNQKYEDHSMSFFTKLLIGSIVFCILAVGAGAYLFLNGSNLISANNIDVTISGPVSIPGGTPVSFDINVKNKNNVGLQLVDMKVEFPAGSTNPNDTSQVLQEYTKMIGELNPGQSAKETVSAVIFGEENLQKAINVTITYGIKGSNSVFTKKQSYEVLINSSPINVSIQSFKEITSGQEFDLKVKMKSNSQETLKNILLKATYPFGFTFISSDIKPLSDNGTWKVGDIPAGAERSITIHGKITGEDSDTRVFHFTVGAQSTNDAKNIGTQYMAITQEMTIEKPFISLNVAVDDDKGTGDHTGQFNQPLHITVGWFNNLPSPVSNVSIRAKLSGTAYDKNTVQPEAGFFNSANNEIVWDQKTSPSLANVAAGDTGTVSFLITPKDSGSVSSPLVNPMVTMTMSVSGNRTQESGVPTVISAAVTRNVRVSSSVTLSGRIVRNVGPFTNSGPIPPTAESPTTYTVIWDVDNTANAVGGAQVTAILPAYVKWLGNVSPSNESVTYDQNSGQVTWNIGNVSTYTLNSSRRREAAFQISFTPSVNQVGQAPNLVNRATLSAIDSYTNAKLESFQDYLTTRFSTDPAYKEGQDVVRK